MRENFLNILSILIFSIQSILVLTQNTSILLIDIQALNFTAGLYTNARRLPAILQLQCTGGTAGCNAQPSFVECFNYGIIGNSVTWQCQANLTSGISFDQMIVSCEGYTSATDPYVLVSSCGLRYTLADIASDNRATGIIFGILGGIFLIIGVVLAVVRCKTRGYSTGPAVTRNVYAADHYHSNNSHYNSSYENNSYSGGNDSGGGVGSGFASTEVR